MWNTILFYFGEPIMLPHLHSFFCSFLQKDTSTDWSHRKSPVLTMATEMVFLLFLGEEGLQSLTNPRFRYLSAYIIPRKFHMGSLARILLHLISTIWAAVKPLLDAAVRNKKVSGCLLFASYSPGVLTGCICYLFLLISFHVIHYAL